MSTSLAQIDVLQLQKLSALEYILLGDLRDILEEDATPITRHWLETILDALLETLPLEFSLREQGGYLKEVVEFYPRWEHQVTHLQSEHVMLVRRLQELRRGLMRQAAFKHIIGTLKEDLHEWMKLLVAHNRHESRLVQQVMNTELGVGD